MHFSTVSAVLAFAVSAYAQTAGFDALTSPTQDQTVAAGSTLDIIWEPTALYNKDTVTITLLQGTTPSTLSTGATVASKFDASIVVNLLTKPSGSIANSAGKFSWAIPADIASFATYGFQLTLDSDSKIFQYSFPFHITTTSSSSSSYSASGTVASTKTMTLSTGSAYTPYSTIATSSTNSTSAIKTSYSASTLSTATSVKPTGNSTLTYITPTATGTSSIAASKTGSATTSSVASATANAAVANLASGSLALVGGLVLALAM